jgi:hypothetical protein
MLPCQKTTCNSVIQIKKIKIVYAINHAATALLFKKKAAKSPMWTLLVSVQLVEILWVIFNYLGWEHFSVSNGNLHLDFLPYSHSIFSGVAWALLSFAIIILVSKDRKLGIAFSLGVLSHIVIDLLFHEKDILLSPFSKTPVWGLGIIDYPWLDFFLELIYGIFCWWYFKGSKALLAVIVVFNLTDLPMMLAHATSLEPFRQYPAILPSVILFQIFIIWYFVWRFSKRASYSKQQPTKQAELRQQL